MSRCRMASAGLRAGCGMRGRRRIEPRAGVRAGRRRLRGSARAHGAGSVAGSTGAAPGPSTRGPLSAASGCHGKRGAGERSCGPTARRSSGRNRGRASAVASSLGAGVAAVADGKLLGDGRGPVGRRAGPLRHGRGDVQHEPRRDARRRRSGSARLDGGGRRGAGRYLRDRGEGAMTTYVLMVWFAIRVDTGYVPARVDEYSTLEACEAAGEVWAGAFVGPWDTKPGRWFCLPGEGRREGR